MMKDGKMFAETASGLAEVVSVNAAELSRLPYDIAEGVYVVGTGSTGAAASLGVCGELIKCWTRILIFLAMLRTRELTGTGVVPDHPSALCSTFDTNANDAILCLHQYDRSNGLCPAFPAGVVAHTSRCLY